MNELVHIKGNDVFTDSLIIANGTNNAHKSIKQTIKDYETQLKTLGNLSFLKRQINREETRGRKEEVVELNEPQASFLITLLRNNDIVVAFKLALVKEFYRMRQYILQRSTSEWQEVRQQNKTNRLRETAEVKSYVEYCDQHGSKNAKNYYTSLTRLVNKAVGISSNQRDNASFETLQLISLLENTIRGTLAEEVRKGTEYHRIYDICKEKVNSLISYVYLPEQKLLSAV